MKWNARDATVFFNEKEYIDTVCIPLIPIAFEGDGKTAANESEFIDLVTRAIEKQFKGRILLLPPFIYFRSSEEELSRLFDYWENYIENGYFKHIIFITSNPFWQKVINGNYKVIWLPSIPLEHLDESTKLRVINNQAEQVIDHIIHHWQEVERHNNLQKK